MREYDQIADWYTRVRNPEVGASDLAAFGRQLPPDARTLDLGCGDGIPVTRILLREGCCVEALDSSAEMVARYRERFPGVPVLCKRAQEAEFEAGSLDAVVAWGVLFHISPEDQQAIIRHVSKWLASGGWFLFTSGGEAGETEGQMNGVTFGYHSLGITGYREAITTSGMGLVSHHRDGWGNHVYIAQKLV